MQNTTRLITLSAFAACTFALSACVHRTERIETRQDVRTHGVESRQDRYDARYDGRQDHRQIRGDRADERYDRW